MQIRDLVPWNRREAEVTPERENHPLLGLQREMNRVFDSFRSRFERPFGALDGFGGGIPQTDVVETETGVEVSVELPGMDEKDIEVSVTRDNLTIRGEKRSEHEENRTGYRLSERSYGSFYRSIPLPPGIASDDASAEFKKGVLTVRLPKSSDAQVEAKRIEVKTA